MGNGASGYWQKRFTFGRKKPRVVILSPIRRHASQEDTTEYLHLDNRIRQTIDITRPQMQIGFPASEMPRSQLRSASGKTSRSDSTYYASEVLRMDEIASVGRYSNSYQPSVQHRTGGWTSSHRASVGHRSADSISPRHASVTPVTHERTGSSGVRTRLDNLTTNGDVATMPRIGWRRNACYTSLLLDFIQNMSVIYLCRIRNGVGLSTLHCCV